MTIFCLQIRFCVWKLKWNKIETVISHNGLWPLVTTFSHIHTHALVQTYWCALSVSQSIHAKHIHLHTWRIFSSLFPHAFRFDTCVSVYLWGLVTRCIHFFLSFFYVCLCLSLCLCHTITPFRTLSLYIFLSPFLPPILFLVRHETTIKARRSNRIDMFVHLSFLLHMSYVSALAILS